jgi:plastocyanin
MHTVAVYLTPILGAEKSKVPFFIAGGLLVAWALIVSVPLGLRRPEFPGSLTGERIVIAISVVLVIAAASTAVITSGSPAKEAEAATPAETTAAGASTPTESTPPASTPASSTPASSTPAPSTPPKSPKATTGTPVPPSSPAAVSTLKLAANPTGLLSYTSKQLSTKAGKVTIDFTNASPVEHDVAVEQGTKVVGATPVFTGGSKKLTLNLKPGTYKFFCTVPGHRQAGMEGTLTVS